MNTLQDFIKAFGGLISTALIVVAGIALLLFFWGILKYIGSSGSEDGREKARNIMLWGIIALFVMVSVWGIIYYFQREFGLNVSQPGTGPAYNRNPAMPAYVPPCGDIFNPCH